VNDLTELLTKAKNIQTDWDSLEPFVGGTLTPEQRDLWVLKESAWREFSSLLDQSLPVVFIRDDGQRNTIGSIGLLDLDSMLRYSPETGARWTSDGLRLMSVVSIEKVN
jgi:hypothetical protein